MKLRFPRIQLHHICFCASSFICFLLYIFLFSPRRHNSYSYSYGADFFYSKFNTFRKNHEPTNFVIQKFHRSNISDDWIPDFPTEYSDSPTTYKNTLKLLHEQLKSIHLYSIYPDRNLSEYEPQDGGHPIVNLIVTTAQSGGEFLGQILSQHSGTFYLDEPFSVFKKHFTKCQPLMNADVMSILQDSVQCKFDCFNLTTTLPKNSITKISDLSSRGICSIVKKLLGFLTQDDPENYLLCDVRYHYLKKICSKFPIQTIKLVDVRLTQMEEILNDENKNVRILYLVRDPRATMLSRQNLLHLPASIQERDGWKLSDLCSGLSEGYHVARALAKKFPKTFRIVHFEALTKDISHNTEEIFQFLHLQNDANVQQFLKAYDEKNEEPKKDGVKEEVEEKTENPEPTPPKFSFSEDARDPNQWIIKARESPQNFKEIVTNVQDECKEAMKLWGYKIVQNMKDLHENFNPLEN